MNVDNPVVKLCVAGVTAESEGRRDDACALYAEACQRSADAFESCVAAHYAARCGATDEERLRWNEAALRHAQSAPFEHVRGFFPSLHLNLAASLEDLGCAPEAREHYLAATAASADLPLTPYLEMIRASAAAGALRTASCRCRSHGGSTD